MNRSQQRKRRKLARREMCGAISRRMATLDMCEANSAWHHLSGCLESMEELDIPKFQDVLKGIRRATIFAKRKWGEKPKA